MMEDLKRSAGGSEEVSTLIFVRWAGTTLLFDEAKVLMFRYKVDSQ